VNQTRDCREEVKTPWRQVDPRKEESMKLRYLLLSTALIMVASNAQAQVAGSTLVGVTVTEMHDVAEGWSVKRKVLNAPVYNDQKDKIGRVVDIIITPDKAVSYAIVNAGGYLKITKHDVAIPVSQLKLIDGKLVLPGATRAALKASPEFKYAK
jgi:PRC-barrel domain